MALTTAQATMVLGPRSSTKQMIFGIPGGPNGDDPGLLCLESSSSAAAHARVYLWADSTGVLRYHTSLPTNEDSDGSVIAATAETSLLRDMSNLITTSIPTSLVSDTDSTDNLGSASSYWKGVYTDVLYLYSDAYITGASGKMTITGNVDFGASGTGVDILFNADDYEVKFDASEDSLIFTDNSKLLFGDDGDLIITANNTTIEIDAAAANYVVNFGASTATDLVLHGTNAGRDAHWDSSADTLGILDSGKIGFGNSAAAPDFWLTWDATDAELDFVSDDRVFNFGNTHPSDLRLHGDAADALWDGSADTLFLEDNALLKFGTDGDFSITYDNSDLLIEAAAANDAMKLGATTNFDIYIYAQTATSYVHFNTDDTAGNCVFTNYDLAFANGTTTYTFAHSTHDLLLSATDAATSRLLIGAAGGTTNGLDVIWNAHTNGAEVTFDGGGDICTFDGVDLILNDADLLKFGDAGADASFVSDGTNLDVTINAAMTLGDGGSTNYLSIGATGALTAVGTAYISCVAGNANGRGLIIPVRATTGDPGTTGTTEGCMVWNTADKTISVFTGSGWVSTSGLS